MSSSPRPRSASDLILIAILVVTMGALIIGALATGFMDGMFPPEAVTRQGREIRSLYDIVFWIAAVIFVFVEVLIVYSVLRYRRKPGQDELPVQTHGHNVLEVIWTVVPTVIVAYLFVISLQTLNSIDAVAKSPDIHIRAVAQQFRWQFDYLAEDGVTTLFTEDVATSDQGGGMHVPVGANVQLQLTSPDVIHAFYVPKFLFKRDVVPGITNRFDFTIDPAEAGQTFRGQCAELCGTGHRVMLLDVVAMTPADYEAWKAAKIEQAGATPAPSASAGPVAVTLEETAAGIKFTTKSLEVTADQAFAIDFKNEDPASVPHDVDIRAADGSVLADQPTIDGGTATTYTYAALPAGTYTFICSVHPFPDMTGTLTVK
ncbi:MAG: cytochrome c oxidase subunit II [Chloroflexota bacterium]